MCIRDRHKPIQSEKFFLGRTTQILSNLEKQLMVCIKIGLPFANKNCLGVLLLNLIPDPPATINAEVVML